MLLASVTHKYATPYLETIINLIQQLEDRIKQRACVGITNGHQTLETLICMSFFNINRVLYYLKFVSQLRYTFDVDTSYLMYKRREDLCHERICRDLFSVNNPLCGISLFEVFNRVFRVLCFKNINGLFICNIYGNSSTRIHI